MSQLNKHQKNEKKHRGGEIPSVVNPLISVHSSILSTGYKLTMPTITSPTNFQQWRKDLYDLFRHNGARLTAPLLYSPYEIKSFMDSIPTTILPTIYSSLTIAEKSIARNKMEPADIPGRRGAAAQPNDEVSMVKEVMKLKIDYQRELEIEQNKFFAVIWNSISEDSRIAVQSQVNDFETKRRDSNIKVLFDAIVTTHDITSSTKLTDKYDTIERFWTLKQNGMQLGSYYQHYLEVEEAYKKTTPTHDGNEETNILKFFRSLDSYYESHVEEVVDMAAKGIKAFPDTMLKAYQSALDYHPKMISSTIPSTATVFTAAATPTTESQGRGKSWRGRGGGRGGRGGGRGGRGRGNGKKKGNAITKTAPAKCKLCDGAHATDDCPEWANLKKKSKLDTKVSNDIIESYSFNLALPTNHMQLCMDSQSQVCIIRDEELLSDIHEVSCPIRIKGITGEAIIVNQMGCLDGILMCYYSPDVSGNILSLGEVSQIFDTSLEDDTFIMRTPIGNYSFPLKDKVYVMDYDQHITSRDSDEKFVYLTTVSENERKYTAHEVKKAKEAESLWKRLGYASAKALSDLLKHGGILNCPVTYADIERAEDIYGTPVPILKGKSVGSKSPSVLNRRLEPFEARELQELHLDVMFVDKAMFLVSVSMPLGLTMVTELKSRSAADFRAALDQQISHYRTAGFKILTLHADGEGGIKPNVDRYRSIGITFNSVPPGTHANVAERKIRVIKERCRCVYHSIPYQLPMNFVRWLVKFAVLSINRVPNNATNNRIPPIEIFSGRKLDYSRDCRIEFGAYAQIVEPIPSNEKNTMKPRTTGAIALLPSGSISGGVYFYNLNTGRVVVRDKWHQLPIPIEVIAKLQDISKVQGTLTSEALNDPTDNNVEKDQVNITEPIRTVIPAIPTAFDHEYPTGTNKEQIEVLTVAPNEQVMLESVNDREVSTSENTSIPMVTNTDLNDVIESVNIFNISVTEALKTKGDDAVASIEKEFKNMLQKQVWVPVHMKELSYEQKSSILPSKMFIKEKFDAKGNYTSLKSRLVVGGHMQEDMDILEKFAPTISIESLLIALQLHASQGEFNITCLDISAAYLNAKLIEPEYMRLNKKLSGILYEMNGITDDYINDDGTCVVKLQRALYGLKQSGKLWYHTLKKELVKLGYRPNEYDSCLYTKEVNGKISFICCYVDDLLILCEDDNEHDRITDSLKQRFDELSISASKTTEFNYLSMVINGNYDKTVTVSMKAYIDRVLSEADHIKPYSTPNTPNLFVHRDIPLLDIDGQNYIRSMIAKLLYLGKRGRPDILLTLSTLATRVNKYNLDDLKKLNRLLGYLKYSKELTLNLGCEGKIELKCFVDSSYASHSNDMRSHSAYGFTFGRGMFYSKSFKQKTVTKSTCEAEMNSLNDAATKLLSLLNLINDIGLKYKVNGIIYEDNMSTINLVKGGIVTSKRSKHMKIKQFWIKEHIDRKEFLLLHLASTKMIVDFLTKPIQGKLFQRLMNDMMGTINIKEMTNSE